MEASTGSHLGVWSPNGQTIIYAAVVKGVFTLHRKPVDRSRDPEILLESPLDRVPTDWSPDGRFLLFTQTEPDGAGDIWVLPTESTQNPFPLTRTRFDEQDARFSSNGSWVVYSSDESGKREIYVRQFSEPGRKLQVSTGGGQSPAWSRDGKAIYYLTLDWKLVEARLNPGVTIAGVTHPLFSVPRDAKFEVLSDRKFLILSPATVSSPVTLVLNWNAAFDPEKQIF